MGGLLEPFPLHNRISAASTAAKRVLIQSRADSLRSLADGLDMIASAPEADDNTLTAAANALLATGD